MRSSYGSNRVPVDLHSLENYAECTYSSLLYSQLESLNINDVKRDHILSHIGKATGIAISLRAFPHYISKGVVYLPVEVCTNHGLNQEEVLRRFHNSRNSAENSTDKNDISDKYNALDKQIRDVVFEIATLANDHIITAKTMIRELSPEDRRSIFGALINIEPTLVLLEQLERSDFWPLDKRVLASDKSLRLIWRIWRASTSQDIN